MLDIWINLLAHVQDDDGRFKSNTETGDETTSNDETETVSSNLENYTWIILSVTLFHVRNSTSAPSTHR